MKCILHLGCLIILMFVLGAINLKVANGLIHKIPTQTHKLAPEVAKQRLAKKYASNPQMLRFINNTAFLEVSADSAQNKNNSIPISRNDGKWYTIQVANVSLGTPPHWFRVEVDWYYNINMEVVDSNATFYGVEVSQEHDKNVRKYNSSASSTYSQVAGKFYDYYTGSRGNRGLDVVRLNGQEFNLTFGISDYANDYYFDRYYYDNDEYVVDAILGLSPAHQTTDQKDVNHNFTTTMRQITSLLDNPIVTVWTDSANEGNGQITLGDLDPDHCDTNWMFVTRTASDSYYYSGYTVHLAAMEGTWPNGTQQTFKADYDLSIMPHDRGINVDAEWLPLFRNISNAEWDEEIYKYVVDCDATKLGNVTFRVGGHGYGEHSETYNLTITGADYTSYYKYYDVCYLNIYTGVRPNSKHSMPAMLGYNFVRNHCLAYNRKHNKIGFADSKTQNGRIIDYYDD